MDSQRLGAFASGAGAVLCAGVERGAVGGGGAGVARSRISCCENGRIELLECLASAEWRGAEGMRALQLELGEGEGGTL